MINARGLGGGRGIQPKRSGLMLSPPMEFTTMKYVLAALIGIVTLSAVTTASAEPHHRHRVCMVHHHHRICHWA